MVYHFSMSSSPKLVWALAVTYLLTLCLAAQTSSSEHPIVVLNLPERVDSKEIVIDYFMTGPFGGTGMLRGMEANAKTYKIDAAVENVPARHMKVIAWLPGCQILAFEIPIREHKIERDLTCTPLGLVQLKGQIALGSVVRDKPWDIAVDYIAGWSHEFFGMYDGMIPQFHIGTVPLNDDGSFEISLPELANQPGMDKGGFEFSVRERETGNGTAFAFPVEDRAGPRELRVAHEYPAPLHFAFMGCSYCPSAADKQPRLQSTKLPQQE